MISTIDRESIRPTSHFHGVGQKVDVPISLLYNFCFPYGKLQHCRTFVDGKLGINGIKINSQTLGGDERNAPQHFMNIGPQFPCSYKTHTIWDIASDQKAIRSQALLMNPRIIIPPTPHRISQHELFNFLTEHHSSCQLRANLNAAWPIALTDGGIEFCEAVCNI